MYLIYYFISGRQLFFNYFLYRHRHSAINHFFYIYKLIMGTWLRQCWPTFLRNNNPRNFSGRVFTQWAAPQCIHTYYHKVFEERTSDAVPFESPFTWVVNICSFSYTKKKEKNSFFFVFFFNFTRSVDKNYSSISKSINNSSC